MKQPTTAGYYNYVGGKYGPITPEAATSIIKEFWGCATEEAQRELGKLTNCGTLFARNNNTVAHLFFIK